MFFWISQLGQKNKNTVKLYTDVHLKWINLVVEPISYVIKPIMYSVWFQAIIKITKKT